MNLMRSQNDVMYCDNEMWLSNPYAYQVMSKKTIIFIKAQEVLFQLQKEEELKHKRYEEEAILKLSQMQRDEVQDHPRRKFTSFKQKNPPQIFTLGCLKPQLIVQTRPHVKDGEPPNYYCPFFVVHAKDISLHSSETSNEQPPIEEHVGQQRVKEEKNDEVVPILKEQNLTSEPRVEPKGLLQKEENPDHVFQQEVSHDMMEEEAFPKLLSIGGTSFYS